MLLGQKSTSLNIGSIQCTTEASRIVNGSSGLGKFKLRYLLVICYHLPTGKRPPLPVEQRGVGPAWTKPTAKVCLYPRDTGGSRMYTSFVGIGGPEKGRLGSCGPETSHTAGGQYSLIAFRAHIIRSSPACCLHHMNSAKYDLMWCLAVPRCLLLRHFAEPQRRSTV